jgi:adenylate kinase
VSKRTFYYVKAIWDEEAKVFYSESDIVGLHIEAADMEGFQAAMQECAVDLIIANHIKPAELARKSLVDLIPSIFLERGNGGVVAA